VSREILLNPIEWGRHPRGVLIRDILVANPSRDFRQKMKRGAGFQGSGAAPEVLGITDYPLRIL